MPLAWAYDVPYKKIYWRGINIGDWRFFRKFANINNYMDTPTKPLQKLEKKDMVAQIANIKSANCFLQTNLPNITLANKYSCTVIILIHMCMYWPTKNLIIATSPLATSPLG